MISDQTTIAIIAGAAWLALWLPLSFIRYPRFISTRIKAALQNDRPWRVVLIVGLAEFVTGLLIAGFMVAAISIWRG